jgi:hypothetical protein
MAAHVPRPGKKYFTLAQANATLPLVRVIIRDITELAHSLRERHQRLGRLNPAGRPGLSEAHQEELLQVQAELERDQEQMREYERELKQLGIELKDYFMGLIDFPCWMNGREVCLCWRLGEPEVGFWHEVDAGFAGRQKLLVAAPAQ